METNKTVNPNPQHFTPSQNDLLAMIASAEAKFDAAIKQAALKREAKANVEVSA